MSETEQNKTEEPTPHKLRKAREKGQVAKGTDIAFFGTLAAFTFYTVTLGPRAAATFTEMMRNTFVTGISNADSTSAVTTAISGVYMPALQTLATIGGCIFFGVVLLQIAQLKGLMFTAHPLKPDMDRINPAKGLKRLFSLRTLKEAAKNTFKMIVYVTAAYLVSVYCINAYGPTLTDGPALVAAMQGGGLRLLFLFTFFAMVFAAIDQVIVRQEYLKQMRMSKSEVKREHKDREGEPRIKQKRKQLHKEFSKQTQGLGDISGSDVLIVNPTHYAVALSYTPAEMDAPQMTAKGRNKFAQMLKSKATNLGIPIIHQPALARALFKMSDVGSAIPESEFRAVAKVYLHLRTLRKEAQA